MIRPGPLLDVAAAGLAVAAALLAVSRVPAPRPLVAFGDSLTSGFPGQPEASYPAQLARRLRRRVVNRGFWGFTTEQAEQQLHLALADRPSLVVVWLGANDILRGLPPEPQMASLRRLVRRLQAAGADVVLVGPEGLPAVRPVDYVALYRALAEETRCAYVAGPLAELRGQPALMADDIHPSALGNAVVAGHLARALPLLMDRRATRWP